MSRYPNVGFYLVDIDDATDVAISLNIYSIPTTLVYKAGEVQVQLAGAAASLQWESNVKKYS